MVYNEIAKPHQHPRERLCDDFIIHREICKSKQMDASLNNYYRALGNGLVTDAFIRQALALRALAIVPEALRQEPILLSVDDTSIAKWGKHFDGVGILYDHAKHDGKSYFNGHAFVSLTMSVPVLHETAGKQQIRYIAVPIGYVMSNGEASKLTLACQLLDEVMPIHEKRQVILLFDSWYAKRELLAHALRYPNLNVICNARHDTAMFELPDSTVGRRGRPTKYGKRLMLDEIADDFTNYLFRMDDYFVAHNLVKTRIFGDRTVHTYVTLSAHQNTNPQKLRHVLSQQIHKEVFFAILVSKAQSSINLSALLKALQALACSDEQAA